MPKNFIEMKTLEIFFVGVFAVMMFVAPAAVLKHVNLAEFSDVVTGLVVIIILDGACAMGILSLIPGLIFRKK